MEKQLTGQVYYISNPVQKTDKFSVRTLILRIDADTQYPQYIPMQASNSNMALLDGIDEGSTVTVFFNLKGQLGKREEPTAYVNFDIWKITK